MRSSLRTLNLVERGLHALVALALCAGFVVSAFVLTPDPRGHGTHEQLGLPPCLMQLCTGIPCPLCGMTTAFALMARGRAAEAVNVQPAGALASIAGLLAAIALALAAATGRGLSERQWRSLAAVAGLTALTVMAAAWARGILFALL